MTYSILKICGVFKFLALCLQAKMLENQLCNILCRIKLDKEGAKELKEKIKNEYMVHMYGNPSSSQTRPLDVVCIFNEFSIHLIGSSITFLWFDRLEFLNLSLPLFIISVDFTWG